MTDVTTAFIVPMLDLFPISEHVNKTKFAAALAADLATFDERTLAAAVVVLRRTHSKAFFPSIAICRQACEQIAQETAKAAGQRPWRPISGSRQAHKSLEQTIAEAAGAAWREAEGEPFVSDANHAAYRRRPYNAAREAEINRRCEEAAEHAKAEWLAKHGASS